MQTNPGAPRTATPADPTPADLGHAGAVVDKAIAHMVGQHIDAIAIASALLGGALGLLARSLSDEAILQVLNQAASAVRAGELRRPDEDDTPEALATERRAQA